MKWIYLSPHLDDAVFSCGGLIWDQNRMGADVEIWTLFAGDPPDQDYSQYAQSLHQDWDLADNMIKVRRAEDQQACQILGVTSRHFSYPDCIYRKSSRGKYYYQSEEDIFGGLHPEDLDLIDIIVADLEDQFPPDIKVIAPLGIGNHVDHDLIRKVSSRLKIQIEYYADYPYVKKPEGIEILTLLADSSDWQNQLFGVSGEALNKWHLAASAYTSQIPIFWEDEKQLLKELSEFRDIMGGIKLWKVVEND